MKNLSKTLFAVSFYFFVQNLSAQDIATSTTAPPVSPSVTTTPPAETPAAEEPNKLQISGFVDAYYQYSFNKNPFPTSFTETHNSITPGMANVVFSKEGKFGFKADLAVGPRAEVANGYSGTTLALIKQLYISYGVTDAITLTLGNFGTHIGYEVIDAPVNINYSTSYMFSNGPFYHTGLKANIALSEKFGFMVGIFDDTDTKIDVVSGKNYGGQLSYSDEKLSAYLNYVGGKVDDTDPKDELFGNQVDLTATYAVTDAFGLGLNTTMKTVKGDETPEASWFGAALYANYAAGRVHRRRRRTYYRRSGQQYHSIDAVREHPSRPDHAHPRIPGGQCRQRGLPRFGWSANEDYFRPHFCSGLPVLNFRFSLIKC
jgi:hypothetical protein